MSDARPIVLTGATGFIGRRLLDALLSAGHHVRAVSRRKPAQTGLPKHERLEIVQADMLDKSQVESVLHGARAAYYLVHSMEGGIDGAQDFVKKDRQAALAFGRAAKRHGVEHILYLSGLKPDVDVSAHLSSRLEVERCLERSGVPLTVLRAGFIIGPQSAGFRMLQGLTNHLSTLLINPDMHHMTQPAYVDDIIDALVLCMEHPEQSQGKTFDVGSVETTSYFEMIRTFCAHKGVKVKFVDVPWVPTDLASAFIASVSHLPYALIVSLSKGLSVDLLAKNEQIYELFPQLNRTPPSEALKLSVQEARA